MSRKAGLSASDPAGHHDWFSESYVDGWIASDATAARRPLLDEVASRVALASDGRWRILDIGAGFGALTRAVLDRFANATVVMHDFSRPMLERSRAHLAERVDRTQSVMADLRVPGWADGVGGPFDAVVSSLAIHNVRDPSVIARIYVDVRGLLEPGAFLVDYDILDGHDADQRRGWIDRAGFVDIVVADRWGGPGTALFTARTPEGT